MVNGYSFLVRVVCRLCLSLGLLSLAVLTPALAHQGVHLETDLPARDVDANRLDGLAVGVPHEDVAAADDNAGAVNVLYSIAPDGLSTSGNQLWHQDVSGVEGASEVNDQFGRALAVGDFDGNGNDDLAVGVPFEDVGAINSAGAVNVLYGAPGGLSVTGDQIWDQDDLSGTDAEPDDQFATALAAADFNGDGYDDLVVGVPFEDWNAVSQSGMVHIIYGSAAGLTASGTQFWQQEVLGVPGAIEANDHFGFALAAGNFNGDGYADLAIGAPGDAYGAVASAGTVTLIYGAAAGLTATGSALWSQGSPGIDGAAETGDEFGSALAAGDFDNDGYDDLAVGVPGEAIGAVADAGLVHILYGAAAGIGSARDHYFSQDTAGVADQAEASDRFGHALAAGDFNGDPYDDLAVGAPYEDILGVDGGGIAQVLDGSAGGLVGLNRPVWHQDVAGVPDALENGDNFGFALAAAYFDEDGFEDLAVGVPYEDIGTATDCGVVITLHGSADSLAASHSDMWYQGTAGIAGATETGDHFGYALASMGPYEHSLLEPSLYLPAVVRE